jgi:hypothetical protein
MKNKSRPQPQQPTNPQQMATQHGRAESASSPRGDSAKPSRSQGLPIFLMLVIGVLVGALLMSLRSGGGGGDDDGQKIAAELRADVVRIAERRAERLYLARESAAMNALRDFQEILEDHLARGYGNGSVLRRKLLVTHGRLAVLLRDLGEAEEVKKQVAAAVAMAATISEGRVTDERSLFAFIGEVDSGNTMGGAVSNVGAGNVPIPPVQTVKIPSDGAPSANGSLGNRNVPPDLTPPKQKGDLVFGDATARADVAASDVFDFGAGDFTWVGFFKCITPPYDHHVLVMGHPDQPKFYLDIAESDLRISLGGGNNLLIPFQADVFDGNWHSFAVKREGGIVHAFLDGKPIGSGKREGIWGVNHGWTFGHLNQENDAQTLIGAIKNFSYWNRALSLREIADIAQGKTLRGNEPGLVAHWPMDDGEGATFREVVAGRHGTLKGNFKWDRDPDRDTKLARQLAERLRPFNEAYAAWRKKVEELRGEPIASFVELPEYRAIVELGKPALDGLQRKLAEGKGLDFLLADAVIEIAGWNRDQIPATDLKERGRIVLQRLRKFPKHPQK